MKGKVKKKSIQNKIVNFKKKKLSNFEGFNRLADDKDLEMLEKKVEDSVAFQKVLKKVKQISPKVLLNKLKEMKRLKILEEAQNSDEEEESFVEEEKRENLRERKLKDIVDRSELDNWPPENLCLLKGEDNEEEDGEEKGDLKFGEFLLGVGTGGSEDLDCKRRFSSAI